MRDPVTPRIARFFAAEGSPVDLAVFRIVLFGWLAWFAAGRYDFAWLAGVPATLRVAPPLTGWFWENVPVSADVARVVQYVCVVAAMMACVGLFTRLAAVTAALSALYLLGIPGLFGKQYHHHHLVWFAAILAASPCGDAIGVDRLRKRLTQFPRTVARAYALPLRFVWVLIGLIYLFPGFAKLGALSTFATAENMRHLMWDKWLELTLATGQVWIPSVRVDQVPVLLVVGSLATVAFEISFLPVLLFAEKWRKVLVPLGAAFHVGTALFLAIPFNSLLVCYSSMIKWDRRQGASTRVDIPTRPVTRTGLLVLVPVYLFGALGLNSWPFTAYPLFSAPYGPVAQSTQVIGLPEGAEAYFAGKFKSAGWARLVEHVSRDERARAAFVTMVRRQYPQAGEIGLTRVERYRDPARWAENP